MSNPDPRELADSSGGLRHDPHHAARSLFGIALGLGFAAYLMDSVHGVSAHTKLVGMMSLLLGWFAALACFVVGVADASRRGRMSSLYFALLPVIGHVMLYDHINRDFGGAGAFAVLGWLAVAGLVGVEAVLLVRGRARGGSRSADTWE